MTDLSIGPAHQDEIPRVPGFSKRPACRQTGSQNLQCSVAFTSARPDTARATVLDLRAG